MHLCVSHRVTNIDSHHNLEVQIEAVSSFCLLWSHNAQLAGHLCGTICVHANRLNVPACPSTLPKDLHCPTLFLVVLDVWGKGESGLGLVGGLVGAGERILRSRLPPACSGLRDMSPSLACVPYGFSGSDGSKSLLSSTQPSPS